MLPSSSTSFASASRHTADQDSSHLHIRGGTSKGASEDGAGYSDIVRAATCCGCIHYSTGIMKNTDVVTANAKMQWLLATRQRPLQWTAIPAYLPGAGRSPG